MSVDSKITLPGNVRVGDVAAVISCLYGNEKIFQNGFVKVHGYNIHTTTVPEMVMIEVSPPNGGDKDVYCYFFEYGGGQRLIMGRSRPKTIEVFKALADFFGGKIDFDDCDDIDLDYSVEPKPDSLNCPNDGDEWTDLQNRIQAIQPILST